MTGRASADLAGLKGSRKKVRLMIGDTLDLNTLKPPLDDAWFVSGSRLTLRLKALRGGQSPRTRWCARSSSSRKATGSRPSGKPGWGLKAA